jgi:hypothetical protein
MLPALLVRKDHKVNVARKAQMEPQVHQDLPAQRVQQVLLVQPVPQEVAQQVHKVLQVVLVQRVQRVQRVRKVRKVRKVRRVHRDLQEVRELLVKREQLVQQVHVEKREQLVLPKLPLEH